MHRLQVGGESSPLNKIILIHGDINDLILQTLTHASKSKTQICPTLSNKVPNSSHWDQKIEQYWSPWRGADWLVVLENSKYIPAGIDPFWKCRYGCLQHLPRHQETWALGPPPPEGFNLHPRRVSYLRTLLWKLWQGLQNTWDKRESEHKAKPDLQVQSPERGDCCVPCLCPLCFIVIG